MSDKKTKNPASAVRNSSTHGLVGTPPPQQLEPNRKRRADGERSRHAILHAAAQLATIRGLDGLSIGDLADHLGMSKSGLYAHFGSKEELQLATIETAAEVFREDVIEPAMKARAGLTRLLALSNRFLSHLERRVFPGGCFFAAVSAELDTRPGQARDRILKIQEQWAGLLGQCVAEGQAAGEIDPRAEIEQIVFEIEALLLAANFLFVMTGDGKVLGRGREGVKRLLSRKS